MKVRTRSRWMMLAGLMVLWSCGGEPQSTMKVDDGPDAATQDERQKKTRNIFYSIPSPIETAALLKKAGARYDKSILNDVTHVDRYTSASKQALNLGIYGADLSYASVNNHTQESMFYTSCAKKLADRLGVSGAFDDATLERMEKNMQDRDSLLNIISETYWNVDAYLKENEREHISALMIAGGWVEGLYIATQVALSSATPELRQRIAEQKLSLNDLLGLMATYDDSDPALNATKADLLALAEVFAPVEMGVAGNDVSQQDGVTIVGGGAAATINDEQLVAIRDKVAAIRNAYIN